jgi:AAA domain
VLTVTNKARKGGNLPGFGLDQRFSSLWFSDPIPPALLDALLHGKGVVRVGCGGVRNRPHLSGAAYASPFPDKAPLPE